MMTDSEILRLLRETGSSNAVTAYMIIRENPTGIGGKALRARLGCHENTMVKVKKALVAANVVDISKIAKGEDLYVARPLAASYEVPPREVLEEKMATPDPRRTLGKATFRSETERDVALCLLSMVSAMGLRLTYNVPYRTLLDREDIPAWTLDFFVTTKEGKTLLAIEVGAVRDVPEYEETLEKKKETMWSHGVKLWIVRSLNDYMRTVSDWLPRLDTREPQIVVRHVLERAQEPRGELATLGGALDRLRAELAQPDYGRLPSLLADASHEIESLQSTFREAETSSVEETAALEAEKARRAALPESDQRILALEERIRQLERLEAREPEMLFVQLEGNED